MDESQIMTPICNFTTGGQRLAVSGSRFRSTTSAADTSCATPASWDQRPTGTGVWMLSQYPDLNILDLIQIHTSILNLNLDSKNQSQLELNPQQAYHRLHGQGPPPDRSHCQELWQVRHRVLRRELVYAPVNTSNNKSSIFLAPFVNGHLVNKLRYKISPLNRSVLFRQKFSPYVL